MLVTYEGIIYPFHLLSNLPGFVQYTMLYVFRIIQLIQRYSMILHGLMMLAFMRSLSAKGEPWTGLWTIIAKHALQHAYTC